MKYLVTRNFAFSVVVLLAICLGLSWSIPGSAQAKVILYDGGSSGSGGDPNDEQDFDGDNAGGGYDDDLGDDFEDSVWGAPSGTFEIPMIRFDGQLLFLIPSGDLSAPFFRLYIIDDSLALQGDNNAW